MMDLYLFLTVSPVQEFKMLVHSCSSLPSLSALAKTFESSYLKNSDWHSAIDIMHILAQCHSLHCIFLEFGPILMSNHSMSGTLPSQKANFWHCAITTFEPSAGQHDVWPGSVLCLRLLS
jgi:hypothetical protein